MNRQSNIRGRCLLCGVLFTVVVFGELYHQLGKIHAYLVRPQVSAVVRFIGRILAGFHCRPTVTSDTTHGYHVNDGKVSKGDEGLR